jgi:putative component of membrane protein insertase Oxa1/YidC/SpoIIIJ protein YidD
MRWLAILGILAYRVVVRPFLRRRCLYDESCSTYALRMLREHGVRVAVPRIQSRVRSCRLPASACFVLDAEGKAQLLAVQGHAGLPPPTRAIELLARHAEDMTSTHRSA